MFSTLSMLLKDIENKIRMLSNALHAEQSFFDKSQEVCAPRIKYYRSWQRAQILLIYYQKIRGEIDATDASTLELVEDIWYDVEATCPWGDVKKYRIGRLISYINMAQKNAMLASSIFIHLIKTDSTLISPWVTKAPRHHQAHPIPLPLPLDENARNKKIH
jgi:hypothetical protein